ncbi:MAG: hypothetical protein EXS01_00250 [Phycisphaerales bacterium]|nr:hypothetical protein [Phycisphaerales bacterium]
MNSFPIDDWQFWVATAIVITALWFVVRPFIPSQRARAACPNCPSKSASALPPSRRAELTMEGSKIRTP